jgi:predicted enzyme related to lactoylglutathione lyase
LIRRIAFTLYVVRDIGRARGFYEGALGLQPSSIEGAADRHWVEYHLPDGGRFAMTDLPEEAHLAAAGAIAFEVQDLSAFLSDLQSKEGVAFLSEMVDGPAGRFCVCQDPDGNPILLHQSHRRTA